MISTVAPSDLSSGLLRSWANAAVSTDQADPFCSSPAWQLAFHETFAPESRLVAAEASGSVAIFAEKIFSPEKIFLTPLEDHWLFGCPVLGNHSVLLLAEILEWFAQRHAPVVPRVAVSGIHTENDLPLRLVRVLGKTCDIFLADTGVQGIASLEGGIDGYLSRRSANHRRNLKRETKRATAKGVYFERVLPATQQEAEAAYARILSVEKKSWKGIGECGMDAPMSKEFYDTLLQNLIRLKNARIIFAKHEDVDIGFIFGGMAGATYRGQQFSYDNAWAPFSIGNLMQMEKIAWLCEDGATRYDMGPTGDPRMAYKTHWTEKRLEIQTWVFEKKVAPSNSVR